MNNLARILSHGFAIIVVVILAAGYIYRGELFPDTELPGFLAFDTHSETGKEDEPAEGKAAQPPHGEQSSDVPTRAISVEKEHAVTQNTAVEESEAVAAARDTVQEESGFAPVAGKTLPQEGGKTPVTAQPADAPPPQMEAAPEEAEMATAAPAGAAHDGAAQVRAGESAAEPSIQPDASAEIAPATTAHPEESAPAAAETAVDDDQPGSVTTSQTAIAEAREMTVEAAQPEAGVDRPVSDETALSAPPDTTNSYQLLAAAREAYWMHDYAEAEVNYLRLAAQEPENPDSYGELGNMYFTQGKWEQAAEAYFEAGKRLVASGHIEEAQTLVDVIRGLNGSQADRLEKLIAAANISE